MSEEERRPPRISPETRRLLVRVVVIVVAAFVLGFAAAAIYMREGAPDRDVVTVPDVRNLPRDQAARRLEKADLKTAVLDSLFNPRVPAGAVVAQSPLPGQETTPGSTVHLILSSGRERRAVPRVDILSAADAARVLQASGFQVVERMVESVRDSGSVVGTEPATGTLVQLPGTVQLLVSAGPPRVAVPALVGQEMQQAQAALQAVGLQTGNVLYEFRPALPEGTVLEQTPAAGDTLVAGNRVDLVVASQQIMAPPPQLADSMHLRRR